MWRILGPEDFAAVNEWTQSGYGRQWITCSEYEMRDGSIRSKYPFAGDTIWEWRMYRPLEDTPDLFLKFARLYDRGFSEDLALDWTRKYGLLGSSYGWRASDRIETVSSFMEHFVGGTEYCEGGPGTTVTGFWDEVCWAAGTLRLYEAALSGDSEEARRQIVTEFPFLYFATPDFEDSWQLLELRRYLGDFLFGEALDRELSELIHRRDLQGIRRFTRRERDLTERVIADRVSASHHAGFLDYALDFARSNVDDKMKQLCYPVTLIAGSDGPVAPTNLRPGWGFRNLLGAMYLQMYWLMTSGAELVRCEYCSRIISLAPPHPGGRKRRRDKRFCDDACRQAHHRAKKRGSLTP
jgi:hypothetical protein